MNEPTILMNEDAMEEALLFVRTPAATNGSNAPLKRLLTLNAEKDELETQLKAVNAERDRITQGILDRWSEDGTQSIKLDGKTVYLRRSVYAKVLDRENVAEALREAGLSSMLTPNTNTLSAWLREKEENGEPLPPGLDGIVGTYERFALGVRSGRQ